MNIVTANFGRLIEVLKEYNYEEIKILPIVKKKIPGPSEILFWINYHFLKKNFYFVPTFFTEFYYNHFRSRKPHAFALFRLFAQNKPVSANELKVIFTSEDIKLLVKEKFIEECNGYFHAKVRILPFFDYVIMTDPFDRTIKDFTYFGIDSIQLANNIRSTLTGHRFRRAIDIGTGSGVQALNISHFCDEVIGIDINRRAVEFAQTNAKVNEVTNANFVVSNLFENISGKFNLVVSNPPFVFYPETKYDAITYRDGYGGELGLEIAFAILNQLDNVLADDGIAKIICTSPVIGGKDLLKEEIVKIFSSKKYKISLKPVRYFMHPNYFVFHRKNHITYNTLYIITFQRSSQYSLHLEGKNIISKLADFIGIGWLYVYFFMIKKHA